MSQTAQYATRSSGGAQTSDRLGARVLWFALSFYLLMTLSFIFYAAKLRYPMFVIGALVYGIVSMILGRVLQRVHRRIAAATPPQK